MKIYLKNAMIICLFSASGLTAYSQMSKPKEEANDAVSSNRTTNNLKSGNWQDVLTNFFQLGLTDLTGKNRSFNFKTTLFALKFKTNRDLNIDTNYVRHNFDRNFQFNISLRLDSQYRFSGFSGGITWAAINKRDTTLFSLIGTSWDDLFGNANTKLNLKKIQFRRIPGNEKESMLVDKMIDKMFEEGWFNIDSFPKPFRNFIKDEKEISDLISVYHTYDSVKLNTKKKPLLTFSLAASYNKQSRFDSAQLGLVYLQGLTSSGKNLELDIRASVGIKDTSLIKDKFYRTKFNSSLGFNYSLITNKNTNTSILEIKPGIEYDRILSGLLQNEKANFFYACSEIRLRIFKNMWIPFIIKYDLKNSNLLVF